MIGNHGFMLYATQPDPCSCLHLDCLGSVFFHVYLPFFIFTFLHCNLCLKFTVQFLVYGSINHQSHV